MQAANYTDVRKNLKHYLDIAYEDHEPIIVTRKNNENVIILSLDDYNAMSETHYLLSNEKNANKILTSLHDSRNKKIYKKKLMEIN